MTQLAPGLYDPTTLPNAENDLLTPFHTTDWAGMSELLTYVDGQHAMFPHFADGLSGYLPDAEYDHPLHRVETVLSGRFENHDRIGLLTFQVGQIVHPEQPRRVQGWERKIISELIDREPPFPYEKPNKDWSADDYAELYGAVREAAAARLEEEVRVLAGFIAVQNEVVQLYVQREHVWLRALAGSGHCWDLL